MRVAILVLCCAAACGQDNYVREPLLLDHSKDQAARLERLSKLLDTRLQDFAGEGATDCGHVAVGKDPDTTTDCVLKAAAEKRPFFARYDLMGIDSQVAGAITGDEKGKVYAIKYDSAGWTSGSVPDPPGTHYAVEGHAIAYPCPAPVKLRKTKSGRVTCFKPAKSRHNIMSPNAEGW